MMPRRLRVFPTWGGYVPMRDLLGDTICAWCRKHFEPVRGKGASVWQRLYCGHACRHESQLRAVPAYLRRCVLKRDRGICALCGLDCEALRESYRLAWVATHGDRRVEQRVKALGFLPRRSFWDADHIIPVAEGGGACGLAGVRTLCVPCHRRVTVAQKRARREDAA